MPAEQNLETRSDTVMVSRSFSDWEEHRLDLIKAIQSAGLVPAALGHYELSPGGAVVASLRLVQKSGALALVVGPKLGFVPLDRNSNPHGLSLTELELDEAVRLGRPVVAFMTAEFAEDTVKLRSKIKDILGAENAIGSGHVFSTLDEFRDIAANALEAVSRYIEFQARFPLVQEDESTRATSPAQTLADGSPEALQLGSFLKVSANALNLRRQPRSDGQLLVTIPNGHQVQVINDRPINGFLEVETMLNGKRWHGFVSAQFVSPVGDDSQRETSAAVKPLVFISASRRDGRWRKLLEEALERYKEDIDWWDVSKVAVGSDWAAEIQSAIARAAVAVILISPDYLNSRTAISEMAHLRGESNRGALKLFPVVIRESSWQDVVEIRDVQIYANGNPLDSSDDPAGEITQVAINLLQAVGITPHLPAEPATKPRARAYNDTGVETPVLHFSEEATIVIEKARALAEQTVRGRLTSSCLLFGFAESATSQDDCARLVRDMIERTGRYDSAFHAFLKDADNIQELSDEIVEPLGRTSRNVKAVLEHARTVAIRVTGHDTIHQHHLLAGLLSLPGRKGQLKAYKRLKEIGIDRPVYLFELLEYIRTSSIEEDYVEWTRILDGAREPTSRKTVARRKTPTTPKTATTSKPAVDVTPFVEGPAGYTSEFVGVGGKGEVADHLFVGTHAYRLAELIALRETKLPLAIGLFGNWGSGKSHFMNLIDRRLKALMDFEKERPATATPKWCREIVPIYFNAWHYLDANLWASLVSQIFESLFAHLRPKQDDLAAVQKLLEEASGATARAAEEVGLAQAATGQAKIDVTVAEENRRREQTAVDALLRSLQQLLPIPADELQQQVAEVLGGKRAVKTLDDLKQVSSDARTFGSRVKRSWNNLFKQPGRTWRLTWLVATLLIIPSFGLLAATYLPVVKDWFADSARGVAPIIAALPPVIGWIAYILKKGNEQLGRIDVWIARARAAQERANETPQVMEARMNVTTAIAREEAARSRLAQAEAREQQLMEEARGLHPERRLGRYIEQRAQSSDYRGQLGLVSLARRDFQELSNLFADTVAHEEKVAGLKEQKMAAEKQAAELRVSLDGKEEGEAKKIMEEATELDQRAKELEEQGRTVEKLKGSIERIVLFVDDLDRCQPEKIVEILQAVHLLLAFPLFAVVVGVDQRALRQSLRMQFKGLLTADEQGVVRTDSAERMATPLDYLEKIFHVPFHLPVMGQDGFAKLISELTEPPKVATQERTATETQLPILPTPEKITPASQPPPVTPPPTRPNEPIKSEPPPTAPERRRETVKAKHVEPPPAVVEMVGSVPLSDWERQALREYYSLIQTPRGAKRLLNTYRLVRAGIPKDEWADFSAGEYRLAMLLLAAAAGYPATAREWFEKLRTEHPEKLLVDKSYTSSDPAGWIQFKNVQKATFTNGIPKLTPENTTKWIRRVEAFTF